MLDQFPEVIKSLPRAKVPFPGVHGWVLQGKDSQTVFFEIDPVGAVTPHSHGAQYGCVIEGEIVLTIGEQTKTYTKGDSYFIPAGVVHQAEFKTFCRVIDIFFEPDRYQTE